MMWLRPKLGLVLGGGGARGGAHLGVLRVLDELRYRPDVIVGTSIGGVVAIAYGMGWSVDYMEDLLRRTDFNALLKVDRSGSGLLGTQILEAELRRVFGDADMRDLSPHVAVVAADIAHGERVLIDRGPVIKALLATTAVPGLFPAVRWGERLLVDGGIVSNVPVQAAYQLGARRVVAVDLGNDVKPELPLADIGPFSKYLQRALYWLLNLSRRQAAFDVFVQSILLSYHMLTEYELALYPPDVLIRPRVGEVGILAMERITETIEAGEHAAASAVHAISAIMRLRYRPPRRKAASLPPLVRLA